MSKVWSVLLAAAVVGGSGASRSAWAAFDTEVLSAVEPDKPLPDVHLGVTFDRRMRRARIAREWIQDPGGMRQALDVRELTYSETVQRLLIDLRVALFRDLELHAQAPLILSDESDIVFADGVEESTIFGSVNANDPTSSFRYPLTTVPATRRRAGFGDMMFGLSWSPFVDRKDASWPTITLRADVITPTGAIRDPKDQRALAGSDGSGDVGLGTLTFDVSLALSKRTRMRAPYLDPYVVFGSRLPIAMGEQRDRGLEPPVSGRLKVGTAIVMAERGRRDEKYSVDLGFGVRMVGAGRTYSELSDYLPDFDQTRLPATIVYADYDNPANYASQLEGASCGILDGVPCGELNWVEQHMVLTGSLAVLIQPSRWVRFRLGVDATFTTNHVITGERVGEDTDPPSAAGRMCGSTTCLGRVNVLNSRDEDERSRFYDPRYDEVGRRLLAEQILSLRLFLTTFITF
ncbi:MAG: hypothetical protein AAF449_19860 [Myxococcota bacterium]